MQIAHRRERHAETVLTSSQALIVWVVLAIIAADAVAILVVLGMMTVWEAAVALFAVLALAAGAIWTLLLIRDKRSTEVEEGGSSEGSPDGMPLDE
jgi:cyanate permease